MDKLKGKEKIIGLTGALISTLLITYVPPLEAMQANLTEIVVAFMMYAFVGAAVEVAEKRSS